MIAKKKLQFKFAHTQAGTSDVVYLPNGEQILTCGADGNIILSTVKDPQSPDSPTIERSSAVNCVSVSRFGDKFVIGTEDHEVVVYSLPSMEFQSILCRFTLPVHHVVFSPSGSVAAAGGDDGTLKVIVVDTAQGTTMKAHDGPLLSLAFDPKGKYLASAGGDSNIIIWDITSGVSKLTTIPIAKVDPTVPYQRLRLSWNHDGSLLAVPGDKDVSIVERDTWTQVTVLKERHSSPVSLTAWSPSGRYLATCDLESKIVVWDMNTKEDLETYKHDKTITGFAWNPTGNTLVVVDVLGKQGTWDNVIPHNFAHPTSGTLQEQKKVEAVAAMIESERQEAEEEIAAAASDDDEPEGGKSRRRLKKRIADDEDDFVVPDDDVEMKDSTEDKKSTKEKTKGEKKEVVKVVAPQAHPPIQPGATPEGLKRRFLAYNLLGSIVTREEGERSAIEIEFADVAFHNKISINDAYNFTLGALGESGAVFACRSSVDKNNEFVNSAISFRPFNAWASTAEWVLNLSPTEDAVCVGVSKNHVLVATSQNYLRVFTLGGVQRAIMCIPGAPVCIAAEGDWAAIVYNAFPGLAMLQLNLKDGTTRYDSGLPLSPNATLTWVGFAGETVCTADSRGILRALTHVWMASAAPPRWVPLVDFTVQRAQGDTHWVVGVTEKQVMCVICKDDKHPQVLPRPVLSVIDLAVPIIERGETTELEESYIRGSLFLNSKFRRAMDRGETSSEELDKQTAAVETYLIRMVQIACKKDQQARAFDLASLLTLRKSITIAKKVAHSERRTTLSNKMNELLEAFENRDSKAEEELNSQYFRDQLVQATAETVQQLQQQYNELQVEVEHGRALAKANATPQAKSTAASEPVKKAGKLSALTKTNGSSNGHSNGHKTEHGDEAEKDEEPPAKYVSPYESEEEEEDEEEKEREEESEDKPAKEEKEEKEDKDEEKEKEEEKEEEEEEKPKPKEAVAAKKSAAKKPKKDDDEEKTEKKATKGKKGAAKKAKSPAKPVDPSKLGKNPFVVKKPATTPKGQQADDDEKDNEHVDEAEKDKSKGEDRKRKNISSGKASPPAKTKQAKLK